MNPDAWAFGQMSIDEMLQSMSVQEKVHILTGISMWESGGVPRLGIAPLKMTDGPHGARGGSLHGQPGALLVPCETALAATFNFELIEEVGALLGRECRRRGADILLGPCLNLHRIPITGRHFECFSEDPYLTSRSGTAYIRGVQKHAVACAKHFACNDQETDRGTSNSVVDARSLREAYLVPFEAAVVESNVGSVMCGYNRLNGLYCTENEWLLQQILRDSWGFEGFVMSDWFGNQSTVASVTAGLDVEMPGVEPRHYGGYLVDAVNAGEVTTETLDQRCRPVLKSLLSPQRKAPAPAPADESEDRLLERAATQACVLLKNRSQTLPLDPKKLRRIAMIGPNSHNTVTQGGGSSRVHARSSPSILESLRGRLERDRVNVDYYEGCEWEMLPRSAWSLEVHGLCTMGACDSAGRPAFSLIPLDLPLTVGAWLSQKEWFRRYAMPVFRLLGWRQTTFQERPNDTSGSRFSSSSNALPRGGRNDDRLIAEAETAAANADVVCLVLGTHGHWELEGVDQPHMRLLGRQDELVRRVVAAARRAGNAPVIVVLNVGSPKELPWIDEVDAVLLAHFCGQGIGKAVAALLVGDSNPSGRLPTTWPSSLDQAPSRKAAFAGSFSVDSIRKGDVPYREGLLIGYRQPNCKTTFPFGFGLSYTRFEWGDLEVQQTGFCNEGEGPELAASIHVKNVGCCPGAEVVQAYVVADNCPRSLRGIRRTQELEPGSSETVTFYLRSRDVGSWFNKGAGRWVIASAGQEVVLEACASALDVRSSSRLILQ